MRRALIILFVLTISLTTTTPGHCGPIIMNPPGGPWYEFQFGGPGSFATNGSGTVPSSGNNSIFADDPPWTFTGPADLIVTDAFAQGDTFRIYDFGVVVGDTSFPLEGGGNFSDPDITFGDPDWSFGTFTFGPGAHSITIQVIDSPFNGGGAFFQLTNASVIPEPTSVMIFGILTIGAGGYFAGRRRKKAA